LSEDREHIPQYTGDLDTGGTAGRESRESPRNVKGVEGGSLGALLRRNSREDKHSPSAVLVVENDVNVAENESYLKRQDVITDPRKLHGCALSMKKANSREDKYSPSALHVEKTDVDVAENEKEMLRYYGIPEPRNLHGCVLSMKKASSIDQGAAADTSVTLDVSLESVARREAVVFGRELNMEAREAKMEQRQRSVKLAEQELVNNCVQREQVLKARMEAVLAAEATLQEDAQRRFAPDGEKAAETNAAATIPAIRAARVIRPFPPKALDLKLIGISTRPIMDEPNTPNTPTTPRTPRHRRQPTPIRRSSSDQEGEPARHHRSNSLSPHPPPKASQQIPQEPMTAPAQPKERSKFRPRPRTSIVTALPTLQKQVSSASGGWPAGS
jgi:hypothetical protein